MRTRVLTIASLLALIVATIGISAVTAQPADGAEVFTTDLAAMNNSDVSGSATVVREGTTLTIMSDVAGVAPALPHAQHLHGAFDGSAENVCPPMDADTDGDGFVSVAEGAPFYGGIQVSLTTSGDTSADSALAVERFPSPDGDSYSYVRQIEVSEEIADNVGDLAYVVHGIDINGNGEYDAENGQSSIDPDLPLEATIPAACGELSAAVDAEVYTSSVESMNDSGAQATTTVVSDGTSATVSIFGIGFAPDLPHAQHLHGSLEADAQNVCPPMDADTDGDGFVSVAEGVPFYGGIQVSLTTSGDTSADSGLAVDRFPVAGPDGTITYSRTIEVTEDVAAALESLAVVVHGIDINENGEYDFDNGESSLDPEVPFEATVPAACGTFAAGEMPGEPGETDRETGRVAGENRIETAVAVSQRAFPDGSDVVYLSAQDVNPDALVGGVLTDGPILLVPSTGDLPQAVADEIDRLDPDTVLTLGGSAVVSDEILQQAGNS